MKQREFWIYEKKLQYDDDEFYAACTRKLPKKLYPEPLWHVREVNPDLDAAVEGLVNVLELIMRDEYAKGFNTGIAKACKRALANYREATRQEKG